MIKKINKTINYCWTSKKPINGLRHFVIINEVCKNSQSIFQLVSVLDVEINLEVCNEELMSKNNWHSGWLELSKSESITNNYFEYKLEKKTKNINREIFVNADSLFYIS